MVNLSRRNFLSSMGMTIAAGGLAGMNLSEAMAQPIEKLAESMPTTVLGRTGWETKIIGLGTLFYTNPEVPGEYISDTDSDRLINTTLDYGINVIETGIVYRDAEVKIGRVIPKRRRNEIFLSSKSIKRTKDDILKDIDTSLAQLKTDYLDLYMLHACSHLSDYEIAAGEGGAVEGLKQAQKEGKTRFIGITSHGIPPMMTALRYGDFDVHLLAYNAVNREFERCLNLAAKLNKTVMIMKPYGLSKPGQGILKYNSKEREQLPETLTAQETLRFVLSQPGVTIAIPGSCTLEYLKENVALAATFKPLSPDERSNIIAKADRIGGGVCGLCEDKPCEKVCQNQVPVSFLLSGLQYIHRFNYARWQRVPKYKGLDHDYLDCDGCGECEKVCPQKFDIRKVMKEAHRRLSHI